MKSSFGKSVIASTAAFLAVSGFGKPGPTPEQTLTIQVRNEAGVSGMTLHSAAVEAARLLGVAKISVQWITEEDGGNRTDWQGGRRSLCVRFLGHTPVAETPGALGVARLASRSGAQVSIFYDRIETVAHAGSTALYVILGHVMAHEIGHVLLGSVKHSNGGLMQAHWDFASWRRAGQGLFAFSCQEAEQMRAGLRRFETAEQPSLLASIRVKAE